MNNLLSRFPMLPNAEMKNRKPIPPPPGLTTQAIKLTQKNSKPSQKEAPLQEQSEINQTTTPDLAEAKAHGAFGNPKHKKIRDNNPIAERQNPTTVEQKTEPKQVKKKSKLKKWPENPTELLSYKDIINPIKDIINKGYRLWRKDEVKGFDYEGYNIGERELLNQPSPHERLSEKCLAYEKKLGHNLIDVVLNIVFLMGIEQGRRVEKQDIKQVDDLFQTLEKYRETNKNLRIKIDALEIAQELKETHPNIAKDEFEAKLKEGVACRRNKRVEELKADITLDATKSSFNFKTPVRAKFKELTAIIKTFTKDTCSQEQWNDILTEKGWTRKQWDNKCKKKLVNTFLL
jgi:hypothetical protein